MAGTPVIKKREEPPRTFAFTGKSAGLAYTLGSLLPYAASIVIQLVVMLLLASFGSDNYEGVAGNQYFIWMLLFVNQAVFAGVVYAVSKRGRVNFVQAAGLKKRPSANYLGLGAAFSLALLFFMTPVVHYFIELLTKIGYVPSAQSVPAVNTWGNFFMSVLVLAIFPPIFEECLFRGVILGGLKPYGGVFAVLVSSALFTLMHQSVEQFLYQFALGIALGYAAYQTGSVIVPIIMHFISNFAVLLIEFIGNLMHVTATGVALWQWIMMAVGAAAVAAVLVYEFVVKPKRLRRGLSDDDAPEAAQYVPPAAECPKGVFLAYAAAGIVFNVLMLFLSGFHAFGIGL